MNDPFNQVLMRDEFARAALIGLLAEAKHPDHPVTFGDIAISAYRIADAMMQVRLIPKDDL